MSTVREIIDRVESELGCVGEVVVERRMVKPPAVKTVALDLIKEYRRLVRQGEDADVETMVADAAEGWGQDPHGEWSNNLQDYIEKVLEKDHEE